MEETLTIKEVGRRTIKNKPKCGKRTFGGVGLFQVKRISWLANT